MVHLPRKDKTGGSICVFVHNSLLFKLRQDLSHSDDNNESIVIEIINKNSKNTIVGTTYRPPNGKIKPFKKYFQNLFDKNNRENKIIYLLGDYNLNVLDYNNNTKVKNFFNMMFSHDIFSLINKPTRATKHTATAIDNIFTNNFFNTNLKTGIIKTDVSDHFEIFFTDSDTDITSYPQETIFKKRILANTKINNFRTKLCNINWSDVLTLKNPNNSYNLFIKIFSKIYDEFFPLKTIKVKKKSFLSPWMSRGLRRLYFVTSGRVNLLSSRKFSSIGEDQAHEQNNKLIKADEGVVGILDTEAALLNWVTSGPVIAKLIKSVNPNENTDKDHHHKDTDSFETKFRDEKKNLLMNLRN